MSFNVNTLFLHPHVISIICIFPKIQSMRAMRSSKFSDQLGICVVRSVLFQYVKLKVW